MHADAEALQRAEVQEEQLTKVFMEFLGAQDDGYQGSFEEYHWDRFGEESPTVPIRRAWKASDEDARVSAEAPLPIVSCHWQPVYIAVHGTAGQALVSMT